MAFNVCSCLTGAREHHPSCPTMDPTDSRLPSFSIGASPSRRSSLRTRRFNQRFNQQSDPYRSAGWARTVRHRRPPPDAACAAQGWRYAPSGCPCPCPGLYHDLCPGRGRAVRSNGLDLSRGNSHSQPTVAALTSRPRSRSRSPPCRSRSRAAKNASSRSLP